jgi:hypothetical protein
MKAKTIALQALVQVSHARLVQRSIATPGPGLECSRV